MTLAGVFELFRPSLSHPNEIRKGIQKIVSEEFA